MAYDGDALISLAGKASYLRGPKDAVYSAADQVAVEQPGVSNDGSGELMLALARALHSARASVVAKLLRNLSDPVFVSVSVPINVPLSLFSRRLFLVQA